MANNWLTTSEAAQLAGYHVNHILRLIKAGKIEARKVMRDWQVSRSSLLAYVRRTEKMGKKRGAKRNA